MAFNGSGVFNRIYNWVNDKNNGIDITSSRMDGEDNGFATGLSTCLTKDGQQTATAKIPFAVGIGFNVGSNSTPSISVIGDATTGFFQAATGGVSFASLGNQVLDMTSAGTVYHGSSSGTVTLGAQTAAGTGTIFNLPNTTGSNGQLLQTDGSGNSKWVNVTSGSGTVNSATAGQIAYYPTTTNAVSGDANLTISNGALTIGAAGSQAGTLLLAGSSSGNTTLAGQNSGGGTMTFPAGSDTVVTLAASQTLTNKTLTAAALGSSTATTQTALTSNTTVATTAYCDNAVAAGGGLILLATVNASAQASLTFNSTYLTSTYNKYVIEFDSVWGVDTLPNKLGLQISTNNGSSYITSNYVGGANLGGASLYIAGNTQVSSSGTATMQGTIKFSVPSAAGQVNFFFEADGASAGPGNTPFLSQQSGYNTSTTAVNNIKIFDVVNGQNFSGNFHLYGIRGT